MTSIRTSSIITAVVLLAVAGCTPGGEASPGVVTVTVAPTAPTSPTTSPTPSPTPTNVAGGCPTWIEDPDSGVSLIDYNRFMGVCVGMTYEEADAAQGTSFSSPDGCPWFRILADVDPLYVGAVSPVTYDDPGVSEIMFFRMAWLADTATASSYEMPRTPEGITIGSTAAEIMAEYPSAVPYTAPDMGMDEILVSEPDGNTYVFLLSDEGIVWEIRWGQNLSGGVNSLDICAL